MQCCATELPKCLYWFGVCRCVKTQGFNRKDHDEGWMAVFELRRLSGHFTSALALCASHGRSHVLNTTPRMFWCAMSRSVESRVISHQEKEQSNLACLVLVTE